MVAVRIDPTAFPIPGDLVQRVPFAIHDLAGTKCKVKFGQL